MQSQQEPTILENKTNVFFYVSVFANCIILYVHIENIFKHIMKFTFFPSGVHQFAPSYKRQVNFIESVQNFPLPTV